MDKIIATPFKLKRIDGKTVDVSFYNFDNINVPILDIKKLKFEGIKAKDITKNHIRNVIFKNEEKLYLQNNKSKIVAALSKRHLNKIISTVFTKDTKGKYGYLKKEIISNIDIIFYAAIPILKHPELKKQALFHNQIIHRLTLPLKIGSIVFLTMITVKERIDYREMSIDEFTIYDLFSEINNKKLTGSPSMVSKRTFHSHYQSDKYSIQNLIAFVKRSMTKIQ